MNALLKSAYVQKDILFLERKVLKHFNWRLTMPTAIHFADYFFNFVIVPGDFCENCSNYKYIHVDMKRHLNEFLDRSLEG